MGALESAAAKVLLPLVQRVSTTVKQLHGERAAGQAPLRLRTAVLDEKLRKTLERFRGGDVEDKWWRHVLAEMATEYVAPDFFGKPAVRSWLGMPDVQEAFLAIARAKVMGRTEDDEEATRKFLARILHECS